MSEKIIQLNEDAIKQELGVMPPIVKTRIFENKYFPFLTYFNPPL